MGIHFVCHHCSFALHVKDFQAGKRGKCPHCKGSFRIPDTDASYSTAIDGEPDNPQVAKIKEAFGKDPSLNSVALGKVSSNSVSVAEQSNGPAEDTRTYVNSVATHEPSVLALAVDAKWFVRPPGGGQFGPAPSQLLVSWIAESRVTSDSFLWREGLDEWQQASKLLPELFADEKPESASVSKQILSVNESVDLTDASKKNLELSLVGPSTVSSGALIKKRIQKRRQQLTMIIVLASISLILLCILIFVLVFQVARPAGPVGAFFLERVLAANSMAAELPSKPNFIFINIDDLPIDGVLFPRSAVGLSPNEITVAEVLKDVGYSTAIIGKWHRPQITA